MRSEEKPEPFSVPLSELVTSAERDLVQEQAPVHFFKMEQKNGVSKAGSPLFLILRGTGFKMILTQRMRLPLLLLPLLFKSVFVEHQISQLVWVRLLYKPWEMFLALKSRSSGQPREQGQEGTRPHPWGRSARPRERKPLPPLCARSRLGRAAEQSHEPGTPDDRQPVEVETGQRR